MILSDILPPPMLRIEVGVFFPQSNIKICNSIDNITIYFKKSIDKFIILCYFKNRTVGHTGLAR